MKLKKMWYFHVLSSGWSKESWAVKHSTKGCKISVGPLREIFVEMLSKYRFSDISRITNIKKEQINCIKRNPRNPILGMIKFLWLSKISHRLSPLSRPILLHMPGSPCVSATPRLLRSPYPAASTTGRFRKVQMTLEWEGHQKWWNLLLECCNICVLAGGSEATGSFHSKHEASRTIQDVAEFGILSPKSV